MFGPAGDEALVGLGIALGNGRVIVGIRGRLALGERVVRSSGELRADRPRLDHDHLHAEAADLEPQR
jgi:hypothetical protein